MRPLYRVSPGSWQPARLVDNDITMLVWIAVVAATVRGWDYTTGVEAGGKAVASLSLAEQAFSLPIWSAFFATGAALLIVGVTQRRHLIVWFGHRVLLGTYVTLAVGIAIASLTHPWGDGIRNAAVLCFPIWAHWRIAKRMGSKPTRARRVLEQVGGDA